jgi:hypothetical protein
MIGRSFANTVFPLHHGLLINACQSLQVSMYQSETSAMTTGCASFTDPEFGAEPSLPDAAGAVIPAG